MTINCDVLECWKQKYTDLMFFEHGSCEKQFILYFSRKLYDWICFLFYFGEHGFKQTKIILYYFKMLNEFFLAIQI